MKQGSGLRLASLTLILVFTAWLGACTRTARLVETPLLPPALSTQAAVTTDTEDESTPVSTSTVQENGNKSEMPSPTPEPLYAVVFLAEGEILNVRSAAGVTNDIVDSLPANARELHTSGKIQDIDGVEWVEIVLQNGIEGWVSGKFLTLQVPAPQFCADTQVGALLDNFVQAIKNQDGAALRRLSSPIHGLTLQYHVWGSAVLIDDPQAIESLFNSTVDYEWWVTDEGENITGTFKDIVVPKLEDVLLKSHSRHCNSLEQGVASGPTQHGIYWPYDYRSLNYVALYRPAPAGNENDWRTWVAGIEYVEGKPYLTVLLQFTY